MNSFVSKTIAVARRVLPSMVALLLLLLLALHLPAVQQWGKEQAVAYLQNKIKTTVKIQSLSFGLFQPLRIKGLYLADQKKDTLLAAQYIEVDYSLTDLLNNQLTLNTIALRGITAKVDRNTQGRFNFDYLTEAFASPPTPDTSSSTMAIVLADLQFERIKLTYHDRLEPFQLKLHLKKGNTQFKTFNLKEQTLSMPTIAINGLTTTVSQELSPKIKPIAANALAAPKPTKGWNIQLGQIDLRRVQADYEEASQNLKTHVSFRRWQTVFEKLDLTNQLVVLQKMDFENLRGAVTLGKPKQIFPPVSQNTVATSNGWEVKLNALAVPELFFQWDDNRYPKLAKGLDYHHIQIKQAQFFANTIHYSPDAFAAILTNSSGKEQSGLHWLQAKAELFYGPRNAYIKNLLIQTPYTKIQQQLALAYPSTSTLSKQPETLKIKTTIKESYIGFNDLLLFAPQLSNTLPFKDNPKAQLQIQSTIEGPLNNLTLPQLSLSGIGKTQLQAKGRLIGLPNLNQLRFDWTIDRLQTTAQDIKQWAPKGSIPNTIQLPNELQAKGQLSGTMQQLKTDWAMTSKYGKANFKAAIDQYQSKQPVYQMQAEMQQFDLGRLLKNKSLGKISTKAKIKGKGLDPKTAVISGSGSVAAFPFNGYKYHHWHWTAAANNGLLEAQLESNDPNLQFVLTTQGDTKGKTPKGKAQLKIEAIDMEKLKWVADPLSLKGNLYLDLQALDFDRPNGTLWAEQVEITNEKGSFPIESVQLQAKSSSDSTQVTLHSSFIEAKMNGKFQWSQLPIALQNTWANYFQTTPYFRKTKTQPQEFTLKVTTKESPLFSQIIPELKEIQPINIEGSYRSASDDLTFKAEVPKVIYGSQNLTNATVEIQTQDQTLHYRLEIDDLQNPQMQLPFTLFSGKIAHNQMEYALQIKDQKNKERYHLAGTAEAVEGNAILHLLPGTLRLNYEQWQLPSDNSIVLSPKGINFSNFKIEHQGSSISLQSENPTPNAPLTIAFDNFKINTLTDMVEKDDWKLGGTLNGQMQLKNWTTTPLVTADVQWNQFAFQNEILGDWNLKVANSSADQYQVLLGLNGDTANLQLQGTYFPIQNSVAMDLNIAQLNMKSIQAFTLGQLTESKGFLSGNYKLSGKINDPIVTGQMQFHEVGFKVKFLNAKYQSINDAIVFEDRKILFDTFTIKDEKGNNLVIDGPIDMNNWNKIGFDLAIDAQNFKAINATAKENELFYGELFLDNHLTIKGTSKSPKILGAIKVNKDTRFTIVVPQSDPSIADREGIVEFIDPNQVNLNTTIATPTVLNQSEVTGINASVDIVVDKEAELTLIIDKATGDFVKAKGTANLNGGMDDAGKTTLTGKYELEEGVYEMTFSGIKRKFDIKKGSYILWKGEPMSADVNITAIYKVSTAPIDLVENQIKSSSEAERNTFKEKIPFETQLKITGELLKPEIGFDIELPENNSVSSKIITTTKARLDQLRDDPNEMNKQVFSLLVLGNFMGENPLSSESGISASSMAKSSASKILSNQLNSLAGDLIKGIDLKFDLQNTEDYSTGKKEEKTDLNIGISKKLFNDRLKVTVGSSFGLEGNTQANERASNIAGDVSIDYQITKDGRYKVRGYRINKYQVALQGEVVETGVSFIVTMDYNKFKELFSKSKK